MLFQSTAPDIEPTAAEDLSLEGFDVEGWLDFAESWRPDGYDDAMARRQRFLENDIGDKDLVEALQKHYPETWEELVPVVKNVFPLVVNEKAKAFKRATFRLARRKNGALEELANHDPQQVLFEEVWSRAQLQIRLEELNRFCEAMNTCFLRIGWDDARRKLTADTFLPQHVFPIPNPDRPLDLDAGPGLLVRVASDEGMQGRERYEFWSADPEGPRHFIAYDDGETEAPADDNPEGLNPYTGKEAPGLPARPLVPWVAFLAHPPAQGLFSLANEDLVRESLALSASATDLDNIIKHQGFGEVYISADANAQKELQASNRVRSPSIVQGIPKGATVELLSPNPSIAQSNDVLKDRLKHLALLHGLPAGSVLSEARTVAAAEALAIERLSLDEYREESVQRYQGAVERLWFVVRSVWNTRAAPLDLPTFDEDLVLVWHPGDMTFRSPTVQGGVPEVLTPNQYLRRLGEGPLRMADGSLDPDGDIPWFKLRQQGLQAASGASLVSRLGSFGFGRREEAPATEPPKPGVEPPGQPQATPSPKAAPVEDVQKTVLNGAQIASLIGVVEKVATRAISRESGIGLIMKALGEPKEEAEKIMADVGETFFATPDEPPPGDPVPAKDPEPAGGAE